MPRSDLHALTADDLVTLANRGLLRRAERDLESETPTMEEKDNGTIQARWSDGSICTLPPGAVFSARLCTCLATSVCRHLLGTVIAYQRQTQKAEPPSPTTPWDPGAIDDAALAQHFKKPALNQAHQWFDAGQVIELVRSCKPLAHFHTLGHTVRYLVPGELAYARCNCTETPPCRHALLGVLAFRRLPPDAMYGLIESGEVPRVDGQLLAELELAIAELLEQGLSGFSTVQVGRVRRLELACRGADLIWPAEILAELLLEHERYSSRDARFSGVRAVELLSELCTRLDAITHPTGAVPQLFVRGAHKDRPSAVNSAQLVGMGTSVQLQRRGVRLLSYFQDATTGDVLTVTREFPDPDSGVAPRPFAELARSTALKEIPFTTLGASQILVRGGKRNPNRQFLLGRATLAVHPQTFQWQNLRAPVLIEDYEELFAHLNTLPPAALRPRHFGDNFFVFAVASVERVEYVSSEQAVRTILRDAQGHTLRLQHPYTSRSASGSEALLAHLQSQTPRFVAGSVSPSAMGPIVEPVALVFESGSNRSLVQPWIDEKPGLGAAGSPRGGEALPPVDPLLLFLEECLEVAAELLVIGLSRTNTQTLRRWRQLHTYGATLGFVRVLEPMEHFAQTLEQKSYQMDWEASPAIQHLLEFIVFVRLAQESVASRVQG
jgi:hypothetical protein